MVNQNHYFTIAALFVNDTDQAGDETTLDCTLAEDIVGRVVVRKLCICGSKLLYDNSQTCWACADSGCELELTGFNLEPLATERMIGGLPDSLSLLLDDPGRQGLIGSDDFGHVALFVKILPKDLWLVQDPLPVFDHITVSMLRTAPVIRWFFDIGHRQKSVLMKIPINILDPLEKDHLNELSNQDVVLLHFVHAETRIIVATKLIPPPVGIRDVIRKALDHALCIPKDQYDFETANADLQQASELSTMAVLDRAGLLLCTEYKRRFAVGQRFTLGDIADHVRSCEHCSKVKGLGEIYGSSSDTLEP